MSEHIARLRVGDARRFRKTVSESDVYLFAGITGDFAPNHVDEAYMRGTPFGERIAHGALLVGFVSACASAFHDVLTPPGFVSQSYFTKFTAPVRFGDTVETRLTAREIDAERRKVWLDAQCENQVGEVVASGEVVFKVLRELPHGDSDEAPQP